MTSTKGSSSGVRAREERRPARAPGDPLELPVDNRTIINSEALNYIPQTQRLHK